MPKKILKTVKATVLIDDTGWVRGVVVKDGYRSDGRHSGTYLVLKEENNSTKWISYLEDGRKALKSLKS